MIRRLTFLALVAFGCAIGLAPRTVVAQSSPCTIFVGGRFYACAASPTPTPIAYDSTAGPVAMCVGGTQYQLAQDDEFANDTATSFANSISASAQPLTGFTAPGVTWSTQLENIGRFNNPGVDTSYDVDPTSGKFGGYDPFVLTGSALQIVAEPVPSPYATDPVLVYPSASPQPSPHGYLSGSLQGPPFTYGYVEWQGEVPDGNAAWPAYWVIDPAGNTQPYPQIQELDALEVFGTLFGSSVGQQTIIYHYAATPTPQSYYTRGTIAPDVSANYHTYGMLWLPGSPGSVTYYIDRVPQATYPATSSGPMNAILNLQVYQPGIYGQNPGGATFVMSTKYYRLYQAPTVAATCGPQASPVPTATPSAAASPSPASTSVAIAVAAPDAQATGYGNDTVTASATPAAGTLVLYTAAMAAGSASMPTGWTALQNGANVIVAYCVIGTSGCAASSTYNFGGGNGPNGVLGTLYYVTGATGPPTIGSIVNGGIGTGTGSITPTLSIPSRGGATLVSAIGVQGANLISAETDTLPNFFTGTTLDNILSTQIGTTGNYALLHTIRSNQEAQDANQPFSDQIGLTVSGYSTVNGVVIYIP